MMLALPNNRPGFTVRYIRQIVPKSAISPPVAQNWNNSIENPYFSNSYPPNEANWNSNQYQNWTASPSQIDINPVFDIPPTENNSIENNLERVAGTGKLSPCCNYAICAAICLFTLGILAASITAPILVANSQTTSTTTNYQTDPTASPTTSSTTATTVSTTTTTSTSTSATTTTTSTTSSTTTETTTSSASTTSTTTTTTTTLSSCVGWTWNTTGVTIAGTNSTSGSGANQFARPWNIFIDSNNTMYIADADNCRIQKWYSGASSGITVAGNGTCGTSSSQLSEPRNVYVSGNDIYVSDGNNSRIVLFHNGSLTGQVIASVGLGIVYWVQLDSSGYIYTADSSNNIIWRNQTSFFSGGGLNNPQGLSIMSNGTVYIANTVGQTILQWNPGQSSGTIVAGTNGTQGSGTNQFIYPTSIVADDNGNFWVVDNNNNRVQFFCRYPSNTTLGRTVAGGSLGSGPSDFRYPVGVALDSSLNIYVADTSNHRIQKFQRLS